MFILVIIAIFSFALLGRYFEYLDRVRSPVSTEVVDKKAFIDRFNSPLEDLVRDGVVRFCRHHTIYRTYKHICYGLVVIFSVVGILVVLAGCTTTRTTNNSYSVLLDSAVYEFKYSLTESATTKKER